MFIKIIKILLISLLVYKFISAATSRGQKKTQKFRLINLEKLENCDEDDKLPIYFTSISLKKPGINKLELYGDIVINEIVKGPIYLGLIVYRCDVDLINCNNYNEFKVPQVCGGMQLKNILWSPMVEKIKPPISCPLQIGNYTLRNGTWDFSIMHGLPLEGHRWLIWARLFDESRTKPHKIFCLKTTTHVTYGRHGSRA